MLRRFFALTLSVLMLQACTDSSADSEDARSLPMPAEGEGIQFSFEYTAPAGSEIWKCAVYPMPSDDFAYINTVESISNAGMHHMTLGTMGFTGPQFEDGVYDCEELLMESMNDLILFFGNQGGVNNFALPEGVVATIPPGIKIIHELHYVNATEQPVDVFSYVNGYYIPEDEITNGIWGGQIRDETIDIKAGEEATEWTRCVMNEPLMFCLWDRTPTSWRLNSPSRDSMAKRPARYSIATRIGMTRRLFNLKNLFASKQVKVLSISASFATPVIPTFNTAQPPMMKCAT